ncbi:NAD-dependent succinate-semialdehyde dehydrogenase [Microbacterium sp. EST19A]|uniref:NAD-dependent succinate-semialdehyde dehydrogenase n=1 Tax=Microbacterium sp. EST19A TaxID=2862681 RepID=UPI001CBFE616|nr:NAD-dependent succinate-semialdehyde dehydrogenase [Microbacterium sp. EST19A]
MNSEALSLIAGRWESADEFREVTDPADGTVVGQVAWAGVAEAQRAADAAADAFESWSATTPRYRADVLRDAADLLAERSDELSETLAREAGKRLPEAQGELAFSGEYLRWFAEEARRGGGAIMDGEREGRRHLTLQRPAGVALSLTPWNFPVSIQARKLAPMLAAGCTVVARVSEQAPLAATGFVQALHDAGVPAGVLNLVHGPARAVTSALIAHPAVRVASFTGSTAVGRSVMAQASEGIVRPLLELGGNAPFLVFPDADLDAVLEGAVIARLRNSGQSCVGANRFLVHEEIAAEFTERLAQRFDALSLGHGLGVSRDGSEIPDMGPVISAARAAEITGFVEDAIDRGGRRVTEREDVPAEGSFVRPTLIADAPTDARIFGEEIFGPVAGVWSFRTDDEAIALANDTPMGLAAYAWTRDSARSWSLAERLDVGILGINDAVPSVAFAPMGGTKLSGIGREGSSVGMEEFQETRYVAWS